MTFLKMVTGLKKGKNFRRRKWDENKSSWREFYGEYPLGLHNSGMIDFCDGSNRYALTIQDVDAKDWFEVN